MLRNTVCGDCQFLHIIVPMGMTNRKTDYLNESVQHVAQSILTHATTALWRERLFNLSGDHLSGHTPPRDHDLPHIWDLPDVGQYPAE